MIYDAWNLRLCLDGKGIIKMEMEMDAEETEMMNNDWKEKMKKVVIGSI